MKIRRLDVERLELPLKDGYRIAGRTTHSVTNFIVRVTTDAGIDGIGCAAPAEEVTGESDDACESALRGPLSDAVTGLRLSVEVMQSGADPTNVAPAAPAARAAVNMALWDAAACFAGVPLIRLLGAEPRAMPTSVTIGISDAEQVIADAERWIAQGFAILKIKTGDDLDADIDTLHRLRACVGRDVPIRVDANQGYTLAEARRFLTETSRCSVE
ncbi:MAG: enolase C-terminal domain-like protein, partial [Woeseiaceae bacterium]|nr:enolase C-terminal domain-like protein [Woeseiaceae bacterium]